MEHEHHEQRIMALRNDPYFRALVRVLRSQTDEQVSRFLDHTSQDAVTSHNSEEEGKSRGTETRSEHSSDD